MRAENKIRRRSSLLNYLLAATCCAAVNSCASRQDIVYPKHLKGPATTTSETSTMIAGEAGSQKRTQTEISSPPPIPNGRITAEPLSSQPLPHLTGEKISINFDGINIAAFANTVFGELLKVTFEIDPTIAKRDLLVTLRTAEPMTQDAFLGLVIDVLRNYGVAVVYQNNVFRIVESGTVKQDLPRIIRARAVPNIPDDMRPVFLFVQLHSVQTAFMLPWLDMAFKDRLRFQGVNQTNGILLIGKRDDVKAAMDAIEVLDQPSMAGSKSLKIQPSYWSAQKLAEQLSVILNAEGYAAGVGPDNGQAIKLVPIPALNEIILFTANEEALHHAVEWVAQLDQPGQTVNTQGTYYYQVQNTAAKDLADILGRVLGGDTGGTSSSPTQAPGQQQQGQLAANPRLTAAQAESMTPPLSGSINRHVTVDLAHNAIIFQGTAEEFSQFRALAAQMDRAPFEVLIEATIAEVTLTENENVGVTLNYDDAAALAPISSAVTSDSGLLVNLVRDRGRFVSNLTANANKNKVTILSSPRVVASSGQKANIRVGTQVPIITTQQTAPTGSVGGTSTLLQDVQYRDTGVLLTINPTVNSNRRVELDISQEVSEAQANTISSVQSPTIFSRSIQTSLSLSDGETVLLGGLISENLSRGDNGVPFLKDIPVLGNLFKTNSLGRTRIELIVLLTPYIIDGSDAANAVRDAFQSELKNLPPVSPTSVVRPVAKHGDEDAR